jgi:DNA-binding transcriptional ArsR family regulator
LTASSTLGARPRASRTTAAATAATAATAAAPAGDKVTAETIEKMCEVFKMLSDPSRFKILLALAQNGAMSVSDLRHLLHPQSQPAVSHHLSLMRYARLVRCDRKGKNNFYRLDSTQASRMLEQLFGEIGNGAKQINFEDFALSFKKK